MPRRELRQPRSDASEELPAIRCEACASAIRSPGRDVTSFLLLGGLTVPLVGCSDHLERFRDVCGHATQRRADLLEHRPAGGIACPGCHLAPHNPSQPVIQIGDGAVVVLACPTHQSEILDRFRTGLRTRQQLTSSIDSFR